MWAQNDAAALMMVVVQPAKKGMVAPDGTFMGDYLAAVPPALAQAVYETALYAPTIPAVRHIASAPVLLPDGRIASQPGYNADEEVLINIPHSQRADWERYAVPEKPTLAEAQAALDFVLAELLPDFPSRVTRTALSPSLTSRRARPEPVRRDTDVGLRCP